MPDLEGVWRKIARANVHLQTFGVEERAFLDRKPYRLRVDIDTQSSGDMVNEILVVETTDSVPADLSVLIGDVLYNLRSALDHLAWQLVLANQGTPNDKTAFPIFNDRTVIRNGKAVERWLNIAGGVHRDALALIEESQPYLRTDGPTMHPLWILNELVNIDKHRLLLVLATVYESIDMTSRGARGPISIRVPVRRALEPGAYVGTLAIPADQHDGHMYMEGGITARVAFADGEPCAQQPVTDVLQHLSEAVGSTVAEFRRFFRYL